MANVAQGVLSPKSAPAAEATRLTGRVASVDVIRGLVMVLMALDHVRDYFGVGAINPVDVQRASLGLFLTRWITHVCAPTFVFLAGTSAFLQLQRKTRREVSLLLLTRGAWLCLLELTVVHALWLFNYQWNVQLLEVIWVIGISMMVMAVLIHLPLWAVALVGAVMVVGHNALDRVTAASFGAYGWIWNLL
ncbi:MAG: heparan-alpha-glucosaminide N-acetyltransferase domain-containing protein, partial [Acidobacteriales bacterium]|nr:heparan-alpha-glucosaminide N-acetyltransferase domain-containing protein [Terriglobales bacterium]